LSSERKEKRHEYEEKEPRHGEKEKYQKHEDMGSIPSELPFSIESQRGRDKSNAMEIWGVMVTEGA
jgi:hypothetical protein